MFRFNATENAKNKLRIEKEELEESIKIVDSLIDYVSEGEEIDFSVIIKKAKSIKILSDDVQFKKIIKMIDDYENGYQKVDIEDIISSIALIMEKYSDKLKKL